MILHNPLHKFDVISDLNKGDNGRILTRSIEKIKILNSIIEEKSKNENERFEIDKMRELDDRNKNNLDINEINGNTNMNLNEEINEKIEIKEEKKKSLLDTKLSSTSTSTSSTSTYCEVLTSASPYDPKSSTYFGNIISQGNVLQYSNVRNVHFGVRKNSFFTGYVGNSSDVDKLGTLKLSFGVCVRV